MGVNRGVASSTRQVLVLTVGNVEVRLGVPVLLGQAEIDNVDLVATLANSHQEVVGLDITVDKGFGVDVLNAGDELIGQEQDRLQREFAVAEVEEILQAGAQEIKDHGIVIALSTEPADEGDADTAGQRFVDTSLVLKLRVLGLNALQLDSDFLTRDNVGTQVDIAKRAGSDLSTDAVFVTDAKILPTC